MRSGAAWQQASGLLQAHSGSRGMPAGCLACAAQCVKHPARRPSQVPSTQVQLEGAWHSTHLVPHPSGWSHSAAAARRAPRSTQLGPAQKVAAAACQGRSPSSPLQAGEERQPVIAGLHASACCRLVCIVSLMAARLKCLDASSNRCHTSTALPALHPPSVAASMRRSAGPQSPQSSTTYTGWAATAMLFGQALAAPQTASKHRAHAAGCAVRLTAAKRACI